MSTTPVKIIVVDDEPVIRQFMQIALTDAGCSVEVLSTCQEGLARCKTCDFDVVFVDKNLPDGTGLQICEALAGADCKVALVTGYANLTSAVEAMRHGVADYFIKPLDLDDLSARLQRMLSQLRLERANRALLTQLVEKCKALERLAARDVVTGLFNHAHFQRQLSAEVERSSNKHRFSLALIALDHFSVVNEQLGHDGGDRVLAQVARALVPSEEGMRMEILGKPDLACRLHSDTFALVLPETKRDQAAAKLQRFRLALSEDLPMLTASIGIAEYPEDGQDNQKLLDAAQGTLARAKATGGNCLLCFEPTDEDARADMRRLRALGGCLAKRAVRFVYQPIVSLRHRRPFAYEALCRPTDPEFRHVGELLSAAARAGRLVELGTVLREVALRPIERLPSACSLFLNIQPHELEGDGLCAAHTVLHEVARSIVLEITETEKITDFSAACRQLERLRAAGFRIALDDFGAGYQGLSSLALLEPDFVKLDMALVRGISLDSRAGRLTRNIREFCDDEGIAMIAEGVETNAEFEALRAIGIDLMQGYLFARPSEPFCEPSFPGERLEPAALHS